MDEDKLTFIILAPNTTSKSLDAPPSPILHEILHTSSGLSPTDKRLADDFQMIGDVNVFLNGAIPPLQPSSHQDQIFFEEVKDSNEDIGGDFQAEVEIMIAGIYFISSSSYEMILYVILSVVSEPSFRRKGLAVEALQLMLGYVTGQPKAFAIDIITDDRVTTTTISSESKSDLTSKSCSATLQSAIIHHRQNFDDSPLRIPPACLVARISDTNIPSIRLFEKLGFVVTKRVEVFREVEMKYRRRWPSSP